MRGGEERGRVVIRCKRLTVWRCEGWRVDQFEGEVIWFSFGAVFA